MNFKSEDHHIVGPEGRSHRPDVGKQNIGITRGVAVGLNGREPGQLTSTSRCTTFLTKPNPLFPIIHAATICPLLPIHEELPPTVLAWVGRKKTRHFRTSVPESHLTKV